MKWVGLFIVAVVSTIVVGVPLFIWANVKFAFTWEWGMLTQYYKQATVGVDKLDARLGKVAFDDLLIEKNGEEFGSKDEDGDETISDNIGDNKKKNALKKRKPNLLK